MRLSLEKVSKSYKDGESTTEVLVDVSAQFPESGSVAILGASGVGKSTFLQLIGGLDKPTSGKIFYGETDICSLTKDSLSTFRGKKIGFVFQFHHLLPEFNALENVAMPLRIQDVSAEEANKRANNILDRVGLKHRLNHRPYALSGGEQQRVAIARALVFSPAVVLLDEPTGNLDQKNSDHVKELTLELCKELNNTMIVVTHSRDLASFMDQSFEMQPGGKLINTGNH